MPLVRYEAGTKQTETIGLFDVVHSIELDKGAPSFQQYFGLTEFMWGISPITLLNSRPLMIWMGWEKKKNDLT